MGIIDDFIARYSKEFDFYNYSARLVAETLESNLEEVGVRALVTYRAKSLARLESKCKKRMAEKNYESVDDIYKDIVDLAGVRVALYFPAEREQVGKLIHRLFNVAPPVKAFPEDMKDRGVRRFSGYSASHYRLRLREQGLGESEKRYAAALVEVQVASVLMHAWSEVEHDLVYKPLQGNLSSEEIALLDQVNGLVIAGEIALESLQQAGKRRIAEEDRSFVNHYELAAHIVGMADGLSDSPISDSGLGRVDELFDFITRLGLDTPQLLRPYMESLHANLEVRPLAEQVVDAILAENPDHYKVYALVRSEDESIADRGVYVELDGQVGKFLSRWIELEGLLRSLVPQEGSRRLLMPTSRQLKELNLFDDRTLYEFDHWRRVRNVLVHGLEPPQTANLTQGAEILSALGDQVRQLLGRGKM